MEDAAVAKLKVHMKLYDINEVKQQKYLFFTGKGGVGKTSLACATAIAMADGGEKVLLISTDPASNLQDVFHQDISQQGTGIAEVPGLTVVNLDPVKAADEYRESVVAPYRGVLPDSAIANMEVYFLNKDWFNALMFTTLGKLVLAICGLVIIVTAVLMLRFTKQIEYRK